MIQDICLYSIYHKHIKKYIKVCCEMLEHIHTHIWILVANVQGSEFVHRDLAKFGINKRAIRQHVKRT
jgi:hypothetical protein